MGNRIGILYHPKLEAAQVMANEMVEVLIRHGASTWTCSAWDDEGTRAMIPSTDMLIGLGGDGTIVRAVRAVIPLKVPVIGVNFGRLGFMAELKPSEALEQIPRLLEDGYQVEERTLVEASINPAPNALHRFSETSLAQSEDGFCPALNDVVVGRGAPGRPIYVDVEIDGEALTTYKADAVIVATATGSTGYSFSAGGPVLHPTAKSMVLTPVSPHVALHNSVVLPNTTVVCLRVHSDHQAMLSMDGQVEYPLADGDSVVIRRSQHVAHFIRIKERPKFFGSLMERLRWGEDKLP
ncbi:MAG: kinase [Dehalococcoidia bacterium]|nr:kinase [Dehalococcoidia bacterium]